MRKFEFFGVGRIVFGRGQVERVGELAAGLGRKALLVHSADDQAERVKGLLEGAGVRSVLLRQRGEPEVGDVDRGVGVARGEGCDVVIGLGGGSAMDAAKAIAGLLGNGGAALDYMEVIGKGLKLAQPAAPWIAVPTTAGTGAEATRNAVIGYRPGRFKASIRSEHLLARAVVIDAELGVKVRAEVTASSGMDALAQLIEAYTSTGAQPMTDALAIEGMGLAARSLRRAYEDGRDLDAREDMALAALLSGIALTNAGLGAVHGFAAPLGANFPVPHGTVCAALLPHVIAANIAALRAGSLDSPVLQRYERVGRVLAGRADLAGQEALDACVRFTAELNRDLKIPGLARFGVEERHVGDMVALAKKSSSMRYNPVALADEALVEILRAGMAG